MRGGRWLAQESADETWRCGMRAYAIDRLGEPGSVRELRAPDPGEGEVRVRVRVAGVNAFDAAVVQGLAKDYMEHRFPLIPGVDASGQIEATGPGVGDLTPGQDVYGVAEKSFIGQGTFAEYFTTPATAVTPKPPDI